MGTEAIGYVLGQQCAPVLAGIKPSNLLIVESGNRSGLQHALRGTRIREFLLYSAEEKDYWLMFEPGGLEELLNQEDESEYLRACGYRMEGMEAVLEQLAERFGAYKQGRLEFPHEMGVLFGYPLGDVRGFVENRGKNYKLSGYWKVYEDPEYAGKVFALYNAVKQTALELCGQGVCILDIYRGFRASGLSEGRRDESAV